MNVGAKDKTRCPVVTIARSSRAGGGRWTVQSASSFVVFGRLRPLFSVAPLLSGVAQKCPALARDARTPRREL